MEKKNNPKILATFQYFHNILGGKLYVLQGLNALAGLFDGLGIMMFVPLLALVAGGESGELGRMKFIYDWFESLNIDLNIQNTLLIMIVFFCLKAITLYIKSIYGLKVSQLAVRKIRFELMDELHFLTYRGFTQTEPGEVQHTMTNETSSIVKTMGNYTTLLQNVGILAVYIVLAFIANWQFALMVVAGGLLTLLIYNRINEMTVKKSRTISSLGIRYNKHLMQVLQNFKYLKATNLFKSYNVNLHKTIDEVQKNQYEIGRLNTIAGVLKEPLVITIIATVILVYVVILNHAFGGILISLLLFYRSLSYILQIQNGWNEFSMNAVSIEVVERLRSYLKKHSDGLQAPPQQMTIQTIKLKNVNLSYDSAKILKDINITIRSKETIAFVGESGAGKTTLANVICGLVEPNSGEILYNNQILKKENLHNLRAKVGYITQEPVIFNDTIFNNVTFWSNKTPENIKKFNLAIKLAHLTAFVNQLDLKEESPLGANGILISGGQKQRISIARELYRGVDLLVMDEATSALDTETEDIIKRNIDTLKASFTLVIIAHRLSTIRNVDKIYLLQKGKILDRGNYNELYESSSHFRKMVDLQDL